MPKEFDWCHLTDPPCPYAGGQCGISKRLGKYQGQSRRGEVKRLLKKALENPQDFRDTCCESLFPMDRRIKGPVEIIKRF